MPSIADLDDDIFHDEETSPEEEDDSPSVAQRAIAKLQACSDWYSEAVHPYFQAVQQPLGHLAWCAVTFAIIAGLPTAKAIFADPYTELSAVLVEQEMAEAQRQEQLLRRRP